MQLKKFTNAIFNKAYVFNILFNWLYIYLWVLIIALVETEIA